MNNLEIRVSSVDGPLLKQYPWRVSSDGYVKYSTLVLHRLIMGAVSGQIVDHIDGNKLNNTRANLRFCTHAQNMQNSKVRSHNKLGIKGVELHRLRYRARIRENGRTVTIGSYDTKEEAAAAYKLAAIRVFGEFAYLESL